jgi:hypothetical protein
MPPYTTYSSADGEALDERDTTGGEEYGAEIAGADGMGVPDGQGWEVWDDEMGDEDEAEDEGLKEDDIEEWSD